jgi:queuine/archaeosine tRNA-ribosyltransferase
MAEMRTSIKEETFARFCQKFYELRSTQEKEEEISFSEFQMGR